MKLRHLALIATLTLLAVAPVPPALARTPVYSTAPISSAAESITNLAVTARLDRQGSLDITEQFQYDFAGVAPHALAHTLPLSYHDDQGRTYALGFTFLGASHNGQTLALEPAITTETAQLDLPPSSSPYNYQLHYRLSPVVLEGATNDILRFAATGQAWGVTINQAVVTLTAPHLTADDLACYTGAGGTTTGNCDITSVAPDTATISTHAPLAADQTLSLYASFPRHTFATYLRPPARSASNGGIIIVGLLVSLVLIVGFIHGRRLYRSSKSYIIKPNETTPSQTLPPPHH